MVSEETYLSKQKTAARYGVVPRTIDRWERECEIGFPAAIVVNKRRMFNVALLEQWERSRAAQASATA